MKRITILTLLISFALPSFSQSGDNGSVRGRVLDANGNIPFENATVAVYSVPDSSVTRGEASDHDGNFSIDGLPYGEYTFSVSFIGYMGKSLRLTLSENSRVIDVGDIILSEAAEDIGGVDVIAVKPQIIYKDNKKILKVKEFQAAGATNLAQVLENAPSITLDSDGNVLLRGSSNYTLLIDGKPVPGVGVNMIRQIPPEMVEDIEIMTNPSAKYDPDGVTGIINLVLKKQTQAGFNGQLSLMAGLNGKYNGDMQFNYRKNRVNAFAGVTGTRYHTGVKGDIFRQNDDNSGTYEVLNHFSQITDMGTVSGNLGIDVTINDQNSLTLSGRFGPQDVKVELNNRITRETPDPDLTGNFLFTNSLGVNGFFYMPGLTWDHSFKKEGEKIQFNALLGGFSGSLSQTMTEKAADLSWLPTGVITDKKRLDNDMSINDSRIKADYENSFEGKGKLEAGYQYRILYESNDQVLENYDLLLGRWIEDISFTNLFTLDRQIHSVYSTWSGSAGKFGYQIGLRGEYTSRTVEQKVTGESYEYNRFNFFPSGNISHKLGEKIQLQLSYSRRINRPGRNNLNPFPQYADNQLIVKGNPYLTPEFINAFELSFQDQLKIGFLSMEAYYRGVNDVITTVLVPLDSGIMSQQFINANHSGSAGTELMANMQPVSWFRFILSGNVYYYYLDDKIVYSGNADKSLVWTSNLNMIFLPTKTTRVTVGGLYNGPSINFQGTMDARWMINLGISQDLFKRKATLSLSVRDLFATYVIRNNLLGADYVTTTSLRPESRIATLTFTYNINNYKRRAQQTEDMDLNFIR